MESNMELEHFMRRAKSRNEYEKMEKELDRCTLVRK